jgi:hypothetical protein
MAIVNNRKVNRINITDVDDAFFCSMIIPKPIIRVERYSGVAHGLMNGP